MAKTLPEEPERIRIPRRPGAPTTTDPEAIKRAQEAAISADRQSAPPPPPPVQVDPIPVPVPVIAAPPPVHAVKKPPKKKQVPLLCRVDEDLGKRIKRLRVEYGLSEQAVISDALGMYFSNRDDAAIASMLKAKGAGLRRIFE